MIKDETNSDTILSRGVIHLVYSTSTGTSKKTAQQFHERLEDEGFVALVVNIENYSCEEILSFEGTIIFFLSTYGDGGPPQDGECFLKWIEELNVEKAFTMLTFAILAFGNSSFDKHCGFGLRTCSRLVKLGGTELMKLTTCDAGSTDKCSTKVFPKWADDLLSILKEKYPFKEMSRKILASPHQAIFEQIKEGFDWQQNAKKVKNVDKSFMSFMEIPKCQVIHIKELRKNATDGRSTLWIRIKLDPSLQITPACNINIFPLNLLEASENDSKIVKFKQVHGKVPFPPIPFKQLKKIINLSQMASRKCIQNAWLLTTAQEEIAQIYREMLSRKQSEKVSCRKVVGDLKPKVEFYPQLGLNLKRTYTLAGWNKDKQYVDLCVSIVKDGLTSSYLKSYPQFIKMNTGSSAFYIPEKRPLVLIANGSGIAPFRSIVEYISLLPKNEWPQMIRLYYGIQNSEVDFYFAEDWQQHEKDGIVEVRLAESRKNPAQKQYVQDLLEHDVQFLHDHLFNKNGVIFICGGLEMSKAVNSVLFKAYVLHCKIPYKAYSLSNQLKANKTVVEEVFG